MSHRLKHCRISKYRCTLHTHYNLLFCRIHLTLRPERNWMLLLYIWQVLNRKSRAQVLTVHISQTFCTSNSLRFNYKNCNTAFVSESNISISITHRKVIVKYLSKYIWHKAYRWYKEWFKRMFILARGADEVPQIMSRDIIRSSIAHALIWFALSALFLFVCAESGLWPP